MRIPIYIILVTCLLASCSSIRSYTMEDDIYFFPGQKALMVKEVEDLTGQTIAPNLKDDTYAYEQSREKGSSIPPQNYAQERKNPVINARTGELENPDIQKLTEQAQEMLSNEEEVNATIYENTGYWIGGYKGNSSDLAEIQRIINLYPNGFAFFNGNGYDIAMNLSFDPDWNVYTDNGRYWWFPSYTNIDLYTSLLFGTYPKYIWTVIWDDPRFDSWAFDRGFNWGIHAGWNSWGWSFNFGWHGSYWYDPWYNGWYDPWYRPWFGYHPHWGYWHDPYWNHHNHWYHPGWHVPTKPVHPQAGTRPNYGGGIYGIRPNSQHPNSTISRPNSTRRPQNGSSTRPGSISGSNAFRRPNTGTTTRPNTSTSRPGNTSNQARPNVQTRPNTSNILRPGNTTRSNTTTTRPSTRPTVKTYTRPERNYRPTYNNNSTRRTYTPTRSTNNNSQREYTPRRTSVPSYIPSRVPSRNSGGNRSIPTRR